MACPGLDSDTLDKLSMLLVHEHGYFVLPLTCHDHHRVQSNMYHGRKDYMLPACPAFTMAEYTDMLNIFAV